MITKSLKLKYCSKSSLPNVLSQHPKKSQKTQKSFCGGEQDLKDHWPFSWRLTKMTLHPRDSPQKTSKILGRPFWKNTFGELLLVFYLFEQVNLEMRYFIFKPLKVFSNRIFKNGYTFLHFLRVYRNVLQKCGASNWSNVVRLNLNSGKL